jgi:hypothetical protein
VVNIRKGQPRKFNWKKGGQNVAKGVKGLKGAFMGGEQEAGAGGLPRSQTQDPSRQGFGFFGNQRNKQGGKMSQADSVPTLAEIPGTSEWIFVTKVELEIINAKSFFLQRFSELISKLAWSMRRVLFQPLSLVVSKKSNYEVCPFPSLFESA